MVAKNRAATRSAAEAALVGCPLPAAVVARMDSIRRRVATSSSAWTSPSGSGVVVIRPDACKGGASQTGPVTLASFWLPEVPGALREDDMTLVMEGIALDDPLRPFIESKMAAVTSRGRLRPISARVAFTDENGPKGGVGIRCSLTVEVPRRPTTHGDSS